MALSFEIKEPVELHVEISGENYQLDRIPTSTSIVVEEEKEKLLGAINLKALVLDLSRIGAFVRIAYNGVGAAGPKFTDKQIAIQRLGYDITKLCDKSAVTVATFKRASVTILEDLQGTYGYLLDGLEDFALITLSDICKIAGDMSKAADDLRREFDVEHEKAVLILEDTQKSRGDEANRIKELEKERLAAEERRKFQIELEKDAKRLQQEAEKDAREHEQKELKELNSGDTLAAIVNGLTSMYGLGKVFKTSAEKAENHKRLKEEARKRQSEAANMRSEALKSMTDFAIRIRDCQSEENMADVAVDALHQTAGALKELSVVMLNAAQFWKQMEQHCKSMAENDMGAQVEKAMKLPVAKRLKVWTSTSFKSKAVRFYGSWVALSSVCTAYIEPIKTTQQQLYACMKENPTYEQSRLNVGTLAKQFLSDLQMDQNEIEGKGDGHASVDVHIT